MRIQHNIAALNGYRNYNANTSTVNKNLEKLSSGYKINRAGDDAAGLAISEKMRASVTGLKTYQKNAKDGISLIQTAEGALTEVHSMLNRMYELTEQARNGLYDPTDRGALQSEYNELVNEINRIGTSAEFNGTPLLTPTASVILHIDKNNTDLTLSLETMTAGTLQVSGLQVSSSGTGTAITGAINSVSTLRAKLGAYQNRLEHTVANLSVMHENMTNAESSIRDTDVAEEMMSYTKNNIMIQAAQAMLAQANQQPQGVLQLLQ